MVSFRFFAFAAIAYALTSCAETIKVDNVPVEGLVREVSAADVDAAIKADRAANPAPIYWIEVLSTDEMRIYHEPSTLNHPSFDTMQRKAGKWRYMGTPVIVG